MKDDSESEKKRRKTAVTLRHVIGRNWQYRGATPSSSFRLSRHKKWKGVQRRWEYGKVGNIFASGSFEGSGEIFTVLIRTSVESHKIASCAEFQFSFRNTEINFEYHNCIPDNKCWINFKFVIANFKANWLLYLYK